jgi:AcrR family transcriptional regulator
MSTVVEISYRAVMPTRTKRQAPSRTGRRAGDSGTRTAILAAAREQFAGKGYNGASLRTIAAAAGVDPALIRHFFGSKDDLFVATLEIPQELLRRLAEALGGDPGSLGERLVRTYLELWEDPASAESVLATVRSAIASGRAADRLQALLGARLHADVPGLVDRPDGELRAGLIGSHLFGVAVARHVLRVKPIVELDLDTLVALCAPAIQRYLDDPLPRIRSAEA